MIKSDTELISKVEKLKYKILHNFKFEETTINNIDNYKNFYKDIKEKKENLDKLIKLSEENSSKINDNLKKFLEIFKDLSDIENEITLLNKNIESKKTKLNKIFFNIDNQEKILINEEFIEKYDSITIAPKSIKENPDKDDKRVIKIMIDPDIDKEFKINLKIETYFNQYHKDLIIDTTKPDNNFLIRFDNSSKEFIKEMQSTNGSFEFEIYLSIFKAKEGLFKNLYIKPVSMFNSSYKLVYKPEK